MDLLILVAMFLVFAIGLVAGFLCLSLPNMIARYLSNKQFQQLADELMEDPDDVAERERKEEEEVGFF